MKSPLQLKKDMELKTIYTNIDYGIITKAGKEEIDCELSNPTFLEGHVEIAWGILFVFTGLTLWALSKI
jgi:hypothetical protein